MKDRVIFIIAIVLIVLGVGYLGYTAYQFFTRDSLQADNKQTTQVDQSASSLDLQSTSNQEILAEEAAQGADVSLSITLKNTSKDQVSTNFEGRVYEIAEIFTFPNIDTDLPKDSKQVKVDLATDESGSFTYVYQTQACGTYYMALADSDYWTKGRGIITYGYFTVNCDSQTNQTPVTDQNTSGNSTGSTTGSPAQQAGQTKGAATTVTPTPATSNQAQEIKELPKAGPTENLMIIGVLSLMSAVAYRLKNIKA
jgi:flagellar basal body-associated protein FliL